MQTQSTDHWFHNGILYQIYPRSFMDSDNDGIGDLQGIISRLDYLAGNESSLGITAIWLSPFYPSPQADCGYDVSDYCDVDPVFGTLEDFQELLSAAHDRSIRVLIDLIPGHTSDEHPWFCESRSSKDNPKRDWYVWKDTQTDGSLPNNWLSHFHGPAWTFDEVTGQYYLHSFLSKQPDLNWDNVQVRDAIHNVMRFWLDLGVDGFRVDWVPSMSKDPLFRDEELNPKYDSLIHNERASLINRYSQNGPELFTRLDEFAEILAMYPDRFMVTESYPKKERKPNAYMEFYELINPKVSAPFFFGGLFTPWDAKNFRKTIGSFQKKLHKARNDDYVPVYSWSNHDRPRPATRFGREQARTLAMLALTLPGAPLIYYGDELGMENVPIEPAQVRDTYELREPGQGRDGQRTPMLWDDSEFAGFSEHEPWLPISPNFSSTNVNEQRNNDSSMFHLYQRLISIRKNNPALRMGSYEPITLGDEYDDNIFAFMRSHGDVQFAIVLNFSAIPQEIPCNQFKSTICLSTHGRLGEIDPEITIVLKPYEGLLLSSNS